MTVTPMVSVVPKTNTPMVLGVAKTTPMVSIIPKYDGGRFDFHVTSPAFEERILRILPVIKTVMGVLSAVFGVMCFAKVRQGRLIAALAYGVLSEGSALVSLYKPKKPKEEAPIVPKAQETVQPTDLTRLERGATIAASIAAVFFICRGT